MKNERLKTYISSILIPLVLGALVGLLTRSGMESYSALRQPPLSPPGWVFGAAWSVLYFLMGLSLGIIRLSRDSQREDALFLFALQLFLNLIWPILFFCWELRLSALFVLLLLIVLVIAMISRFWRIKPLAGALNLPYLIWLGFAAWLNAAVYWLNR